MPEPELGVDSEQAEREDEAGLQGEEAAAAAAAEEEKAAAPLPLLLLARVSGLFLSRRRRRREKQRIPRPRHKQSLLPRRLRMPSHDPQKPPQAPKHKGDPGQNVTAVPSVPWKRDRRRVQQGPLRRALRLSSALHDFLDGRGEGLCGPEGRGDGLGGGGRGEVLGGHVHFLESWLREEEEEEVEN